jgi:hypothetical protein
VLHACVKRPMYLVGADVGETHAESGGARIVCLGEAVPASAVLLCGSGFDLHRGDGRVRCLPRVGAFSRFVGVPPPEGEHGNVIVGSVVGHG